MMHFIMRHPQQSVNLLLTPNILEQGVDARYIQALLGHRDPKSTEVYLHVSNKALMGINSPFDSVLEEGASHE